MPDGEGCSGQRQRRRRRPPPRRGGGTWTGDRRRVCMDECAVTGQLPQHRISLDAEKRF
jgi:hypothetical protein